MVAYIWLRTLELSTRHCLRRFESCRWRYITMPIASSHCARAVKGVDSKKKKPLIWESNQIKVVHERMKEHFFHTTREFFLCTVYRTTLIAWLYIRLLVYWLVLRCIHVIWLAYAGIFCYIKYHINYDNGKEYFICFPSKQASKLFLSCLISNTTWKQLKTTWLGNK